MRNADFKVGQDVFYPAAGVGVIEAIEELVFGTRCESFYVIQIPSNRVTIRVPRDKAVANGLRPLLACRDVKALLRLLGEESSERPTGHWADHYRDLERRVQSGRCFEVGAAVRDLVRVKAAHGLSFEESRLLEVAFGYLAGEVAAVERIDVDAARQVIRSAIISDP